MSEIVDKQELIRRWRKDWLFSLFVFSHLDFQKKLWIDSAFKDIIGSYDEDMCQYFDDLFLHDKYKYQIDNGYISTEEMDLIIQFHNQLDNYEENGKSDREILNDELWKTIIVSGFNSWNKLKSILKNKNEIEFVIGLENKYLKINAA